MKDFDREFRKELTKIAHNTVVNDLGRNASSCRFLNGGFFEHDDGTITATAEIYFFTVNLNDVGDVTDIRWDAKFTTAPAATEKDAREALIRGIVSPSNWKFKKVKTEHDAIYRNRYASDWLEQKY